MTKILQGCIYGRKSRENAATLESQINACLEWAKNAEIEIEIVDIFDEEGTQSSEDWNRPKLQKMIKKIENLEYNIVIVSEQTRISRTEDFSIFKKIMKETETIFVCADTNEILDFNNAADNVKVGIKQVFGEFELDTAKVRLKRGTVQSAKKGNYQGKKPPVGYSYDKNTKRLIQNEYAPIVRRLFDLYLKGYSTTEIEKLFTKVENVQAYQIIKGEKKLITWSKSTIARSLKNVLYRGDTLFGKTKVKKIKGEKKQIATEEEDHILIEDTHTGIVTKEEFNKVQEMLNKKRSQPPAMKHAKHVFSGLIACANCGKHHTFERQQDRNREWRINSCTTRVYNEEYTNYKMCGNSSCKLHLIETLLYKSLEKTAQQLENYIYLIEQKKISNIELLKTKDKQKQGKEQQIKDLTKRRKNILNNLEEGIYEDEEKEEKKQQVKNIMIQIKTIEIEIKEMTIIQQESDTAHVERVLNNIKLFLTGKNTSMSAKEQNEILKEFIDDILYRKENKNAEVKIKVILKDFVKEMILDSENLKAS